MSASKVSFPEDFGSSMDIVGDTWHTALFITQIVMCVKQFKLEDILNVTTSVFFFFFFYGSSFTKKLKTMKKTKQKKTEENPYPISLFSA